MKYLAVLLVNALIAVSLAQRVQNQQNQQNQLNQQQQQPLENSKYRNIPIVALENSQDHDGSFRYSYEDGDGTKAEQTGQLRYVNQENAGEAVQGGYSYTVS